MLFSALDMYVKMCESKVFINLAYMPILKVNEMNQRYSLSLHLCNHNLKIRSPNLA